MNFDERAISFLCGDASLYGVLTLPSQYARKGVLILVGGPQYRAGSHRQFTLLARTLATAGVPVLRFDYRGMGDSEGEARTFEDVEDDLRCAIDKFLREVPSVSELVIWGLCDAASAAIFYAYKDSRISGLVLLNPWVRTESGSARAYLKHYYASRLFQPEFWSKIRHGNLDIMATARSFLRVVAEAVAGRKQSAVGVPDETRNTCDMTPLPDRMFSGLSRFRGKILLIVSGKDLTAQEFSDFVKSSRQWRKLLTSSRVTSLSLPDANHTFSRREWRDQVAIGTKNWIYSW